MDFYFICYTIVGICFGCTGTIHLSMQDYRRSQLTVFWLNASPAAEGILLAACIAPVLALITSLIQGGFWVIATFFELALGAIIARFLIPQFLLNILALVSPLILIVTFGALWGFWYI
jgi:ATP/ADP translocase